AICHLASSATISLHDALPISKLYGIPIPAIGNLADTINYLDDNAISKGGDIIEYMTRVGGVAGAVKIGSREVAALGSTLLTLGRSEEHTSELQSREKLV